MCGEGVVAWMAGGHWIGPFGTCIRRRGHDIVCWPGSDLGLYLHRNGAACSNYYLVSHQALAMIVLSYVEMCLEVACYWFWLRQK